MTHPGTDGADNYLGPHDGMNMSTTALQSLTSGRIQPLVENRAISELRRGQHDKRASSDLLDLLIDPTYKDAFSRAKLPDASKRRVVAAAAGAGIVATGAAFASYRGFDVYHVNGVFYGVPETLGAVDPSRPGWNSDDRIIRGASFSQIRSELDSCEAHLIESRSNLNICAVGERYAIVPRSLGPVDFRVRKQRDDGRIAWADSLTEARSKAETLSSRGQALPRRAPAESKSPAVLDDSRAMPQPDSISSLTLQVAQLKQRLRGRSKHLRQPDLADACQNRRHHKCFVPKSDEIGPPTTLRPRSELAVDISDHSAFQKPPWNAKKSICYFVGSRETPIT